jgi:hypothetical protein
MRSKKVPRWLSVESLVTSCMRTTGPEVFETKESDQNAEHRRFPRSRGLISQDVKVL